MWLAVRFCNAILASLFPMRPARIVNAAALCSNGKYTIDPQQIRTGVTQRSDKPAVTQFSQPVH